MYTFTLTPAPRGKLLLKKFNDRGELVFSHIFKPHDIKERGKTTSSARLSEQALLKLIGRFEAGERDEGDEFSLSITVEDEQAPTLPAGNIEFSVRGLYSPASTAILRVRAHNCAR